MNNHKEDAFWMVWCPTGHAPTYKHESEQSAITEAERLATANPSNIFYVLRATHRREVCNMVRTTLQYIPF